MNDILLKNGDLCFNNNDIVLTTSLAQEIIIRLKWLFGEWIFNPDLGIPYLEELAVKNPNLDYIESILTDEIMGIDRVNDVDKLEIKIDKETRIATIYIEVRTENEIIKQEVELCLNMV